jgi:hypothetical protein
MHDALHRSQPYARALERFRGVQALEYAEQLVYVLHVEADSIIANEDYYLVWPLLPAPDFNFSLRAGSGKFHRIGNQVDQHQP